MRALLHARVGGRRRAGRGRGGTLAGPAGRAACWRTSLAGDPSVVVHAVGVPGDRAPVHARLADVPGTGRARGRRRARADDGGRRGPRPGPARRARDRAADRRVRRGGARRAATGSARCCARRTAPGMRVVGPGSYGILSTRAGGLQLNASLAQTPPARRAGRACSASPPRWRSPLLGGGAAPGDRALAVRLRRAPRRRLRQRPHAVLGRRRRHGRRRPVPGVDRATRASSPGSPGGCR